MKIDIKGQKGQRLGELLIHHGCINSNHLKEALKVQSQCGERIGSIIVQLGFSDTDTVLGFLGKQLGVPGVNLYSVDIDPATLGMLPFSKIKQYRVLPFFQGDKNVTIAMVNPNNLPAIDDLGFILNKPIEPVVVLSFQMAEAIMRLETLGGNLDAPLRGKDLEEMKTRKAAPDVPVDFKLLLRKFVEERGSDLLLSAGVPPCIKKDNELRRLSAPPLTPQQTQNYAHELIPPQHREEFASANETDFAYTFPDIGRFRFNIFKQRNSLSISARHIVEIIPRFEELGLPPWIEDFALKTQGLILITGPVGHGKTTTLAALVDIINTRRKCNIITIEDPIEYLHKHKSSNVNQREVGVDTESFHEGLRHIFRQAPDVIVIGEMRDPESFSISLQAAETGHLVLSTLHSNTATSTIERVIDIFPPHQQQQIRVQLAENFLLIMNQRLVPMKTGTGRILAYEKLINTYRVRNLIREGKTHQIRSMLQQSADDFLSIDQSLARLCIEGKIAQETGLRFCDNQVYYTELVNRGIAK